MPNLLRFLSCQPTYLLVLLLPTLCSLAHLQPKQSTETLQQARDLLKERNNIVALRFSSNQGRLATSHRVSFLCGNAPLGRSGQFCDLALEEVILPLQLFNLHEIASVLVNDLVLLSETALQLRAQLVQ
jgi:hypothetical protein